MDRVEMAIVVREYAQNYWVLGALPLAVILECALGFPKGWPNPNQWIGRLVSTMERGIRAGVLKGAGDSRTEAWAGIFLVTVVVGFVASSVWLTTELLDLVGGLPTLIGRTLLIYLGLSIRGLGREAIRISTTASPAEARRGLAPLIGADPGPIDDDGVQRGCLEFLGENTNEAVIAPLVWFAIAGPAGLWAYRSIEILYRMVGSRSAVNVHFGQASVTAERLANVLSARVTWLLIALSAAILGEDGLAALRIGRRDARKRARASQSWGLAAIAGALGVQFGGRTMSGSLAISRPMIGDPKAAIDRSMVRRGVRIVLLAGLHAAFLAWSARIVVLGG